MIKKFGQQVHFFRRVHEVLPTRVSEVFTTWSCNFHKAPYLQLQMR